MNQPPFSGSVRAYIGLGSNLGDRLENLRRALAQLASARGVALVSTSSIYETAPIGPEQPDYLNAAAAVQVTVPPERLLELMQEIEARLGRTREVRWGARTIDLDLLLYGNQVIQTESLRVPHPAMTNRAFVLVPLLEIDPDLELPSGEPLDAFCERNPSGITLFSPPESVSSSPGAMSTSRGPQHP